MGDPMDLNFEGLEMQKMQYITEQNSKSRWKIWGKVMTLSLGVNVITRQMTYYLLVYFIFVF